MSTEPPANPDANSDVNPNSTAAQPVEEMIPLVKPAAEAIAEGTDPAEPERPPTPAEMDCFECRTCGYTYEPAKGDNRSDILPGIEFRTLPTDWRCPVCGSSRTQFSNIGPVGTASGFKENLNYGFGVNTLTPGQKNLLIFGALGIAVLFFLSLYGLQ
jgi:rubredoxin